MRYLYKCSCPLGLIGGDVDTAAGGVVRSVPVVDRNNQTCNHCGSILERPFDASGLKTRICIPVYMMAGTADNFPPEALLPRTEGEKQNWRDAGLGDHPALRD